MRFNRKRTIAAISIVCAWLVAHQVGHDSVAAHKIGWTWAYLLVYFVIYAFVTALLYWMTEEA